MASGCAIVPRTTDRAFVASPCARPTLEPLLSKPTLILRRQRQAIGPDPARGPTLLIGVEVEALDSMHYEERRCVFV
jgi:hypothetical protein